MTAHWRTFRASIFKNTRISLTYRPWLINSLVSPVIWIAISIFTYVGIASPQAIGEGFRELTGSPEFTGFLILGQTIYSFFTAMNWRGGMALERERFYGTFEMILLSPANRVVMVLGEAIWGMVDSGWVIFLTTLIASLLFGLGFNVTDPLAVVGGLALTFLAMISLGLFFAGFYVLSRSAGPIAHAVQSPIRFFTGVSFPISALPVYLQFVSYAIPVTFGMTVVRSSLLRGGSVAALSGQLAPLAVFTVLFFILGVWMIRRMEHVAKSRGTLHTF
ncbi:MAG: ABC transporter permease [Candidatus Geothermarchaeales archaeon]